MKRFLSKHCAMRTAQSAMIGAVLACGGQLSSVPTHAPADATPVTAEPVSDLQGVRFNSGITTRERMVVRTRATWEALWPQIVGTVRPIPPVPAVDFATKTVIVASMGTRSSGGYVISVDDVRQSRGDAWITVTERSPGTSCGTTAAITTPVAAVAVPRFDGVATFVERTTTVNC
jgi:hypothetical protein